MDDVGDRPDLDNATGVHHCHPIGGLCDDPHVVGDQHHGCAVIAAEPFHQLDDLRLDRHVERSRRLVGDDELGICRDRKRDDDALAHSARELMRIMINAARRRRYSNLFEKLYRSRARLRRVERQMRSDRLDQLAGDGVQRVERSQRILEHRADLPAADPAHRVVRQIVDAAAAKPHLACRDPARRIDQADYRGARERLPRARLADDAQNFAFADLERDLMYRA